MTKLTRRRALAGAAAACSIGTLESVFSPTRAAVPLSGKQAPSYYRHKVGEFEVTIVNDGVRNVAMTQGYITNVDLQRALEVTEAAYMPKGHRTVPFNVTVVNTGSKLVLIDTGFGPDTPSPVGRLVTNLAAAGIEPANIDIVLISHFHADHINGLRAANGGLVFPNAEIMVPAADWAFFMDDENMSKAPEGVVRNHFQNSRRVFAGLADKVTRYDGGKEVAPGITAIHTPGHSPGHTAFAIASGSGRMIVQGDVTTIPELFLRNPGWHVAVDLDPTLAEQTRRKLYDMAAFDKTLVAGYHFAFPSLGYVEKDGNGYRLVPARWNPVL